ELITRIMLYRFTTLNREEVLRMLGLTTDELKKTRFYQEVYAEGLQQGEAAVVLRQLRRRFGSVPNDLEERIRRLSPEQIEALAEALLDFTDLEEVSDWLNRSL
ncbi:DUF4351 domain-containing protein, partial [Thermosynechococcus sp.]|uniref:DUF4351 domain-containing protein n=1 Tax=Thermosynechococcus sp. TaxID=2814275 RepID=UPI00391C71ED